MIHIRQPTNKSCGQTCIAMIAGITVERVFKEYIPDDPTHAKELISALVKLGFKTSGWRHYINDLSLPSGMTTWCIVRIIWQETRSQTHWVVRHRARYYDPAEKESQSTGAWKYKGGRAMTYIHVWR